jgi:hypothetical protein
VVVVVVVVVVVCVCVCVSGECEGKVIVLAKTRSTFEPLAHALFFARHNACSRLRREGSKTTMSLVEGDMVSVRRVVVAPHEDGWCVHSPPPFVNCESDVVVNSVYDHVSYHASNSVSLPCIRRCGSTGVCE